MGSYASLNIFSAHTNKISRTLPMFLSNCTSIHYLDLRKNNLRGKLPHYLESFSLLKILNFGYNNFHGGIPEWVTNFNYLYALDLSNIKFSERMPLHFERLQGFVKSSNYISFEEEMTLHMAGCEYTLTCLSSTNTILDLSNNNLVRKIPASIGTLTAMQFLNLSGNQLEGLIPTSLSNISTLEELDLSKNNLSG